jgi:hypothetical protein
VEILGYTEQRPTLGDIIDSLDHKNRNGKEAEVVKVELWSVPF